MAGLLFLVAIPLGVQLVAYWLFAKFAMRVPTARSIAVAAVRVTVGAVLFWGLVAIMGADTKAREVLFISAPVAWALASLLDSKKSWTRFAIWVVAGAALSLAVNEVFWMIPQGGSESLMDSDFHWPFG